MNDEIAIALVQKIMISIFGNYKGNSLEEILNQYAFDIKLPEQVIDSTTEKLLGLLLQIQINI